MGQDLDSDGNVKKWARPCTLGHRPSGSPRVLLDAPGRPRFLCFYGNGEQTRQVPNARPGLVLWTPNGEGKLGLLSDSGEGSREPCWTSGPGLFCSSVIPETPLVGLLSIGFHMNKITLRLPFCSRRVALNTSYMLMIPESLSELHVCTCPVGVPLGTGSTMSCWSFPPKPDLLQLVPSQLTESPFFRFLRPTPFVSFCPLCMQNVPRAQALPSCSYPTRVGATATSPRCHG